MKLTIVCSTSASAVSSSSASSTITSNPVASISHPDVQHQQPLITDVIERTGANVVKSLPVTQADNCSAMWHGSINGDMSLLWHRPELPENSSRRLQPPDSSPHRTRTADRSPLRQEVADEGVRLGSWHAPYRSSRCSPAQRNGLVTSAAMERMDTDTSEELPLNLSVGVRSSASSNNADSRRRIFPSGWWFFSSWE